MSNEIMTRLDRLEAMLVTLVERQTIKEWYTTAEFARAVGKAIFTIREYCRLGRLYGETRQNREPSVTISVSGGLFRLGDGGAFPMSIAVKSDGANSR